jgi:protein phosphatase
VRAVNEDAVYFDEQDEGIILAMVADGMGGHQAGEVASGTAIDVIRQELQDVTPRTLAHEARNCLEAAILKANQAIYQRAQADPQLSGMGTTIVVALIAHDWGWIAHIGDSRAYAWQSSRLQPITADHSLVNELVKSGQLRADEANRHPQRNILVRALGTDRSVEVEINAYHPHADDLLLLCSDGLTTMLSDEQISEVLQSEGTLQEKADRLLEQALQQGGEDNISLVLFTPPARSFQDRPAIDG